MGWKDNKTILKTVKVPMDEFLLMKKELHHLTSKRNGVVDVLNNILDMVAEDICSYWDEVARKAGYSSYEEMSLLGYDLRIHWATNEIQVWQTKDDGRGSVSSVV